VAERRIGWLKCCQRVATRDEKRATHFLDMIKLAMIQRCLALLDLTKRTQKTMPDQTQLERVLHHTHIFAG